jgi:type II secretory pathway pseudopilin PulG
MLVVVGLLVSGLLIGVSGFLDTQRERVVRSELGVVGNRLAADLTGVDALAETVDSDGEVRVTASLVERVAGSTYRIAIESDGPGNRYEIALTSTTPEVTVTTSVKTLRPVSTGTFNGGAVTITYDGSTDTREVEHA